MLELDKSNINESIQMLGQPSSRESKSNENGDFEIIKYAYAKANPSGASARVLYLEFRNGLLNAKLYNSGFAEDKTDFNYENYRKIKNGESNKEDVLMLMGDPSGIYNCPSTFTLDKCKNASVIWVWLHTQKSQGYNTESIKSKAVSISFDEKGTVTEINTSSEL